MTRGTDSTAVADVLYAVGDERLVVFVDGDLPRRDLATELVTDAIAMREDRLEVLEDLRDIGSELGWSLAVATYGARTNVRIS